MTTITATQLATVRRRSGDVTTPYDLTDTEIDAIYVDATLGSFNVLLTAQCVLEERMGIATNAIAVSSPLGSLTRNQKFEQLERMWERLSLQTGRGQPEVGSGGIAEWSNYG